MIRDIENKYIQTQAQLQSVKAQIAACQRTTKLNEATQKQLDQAVSGDDARVWQGVGKMFVSSNVKEYKKELDNESKNAQDTLKALNTKQRYLEQTYENVTKAIAEISKKMGQSS